jgi:outer membrane protein TolC
VGWALAHRQAGRLASELEASRATLAAAEARLQAAEDQRAQVREQLGALAGEATTLAERLGGLEALLATEPAPAADAQPTRNEAERTD